MGVRGLTTFIAQNSDRYLKHYELHDTYLVIDGNNLAAQLYKWHAHCYDCFGGDYDKYTSTVINFFNVLRECNVIPLIVYDGGYEEKKLKTVYNRVKHRIKQTKQLNCITEGSMTVFPLFLRELFVEITMKLNLKIVRCLVEADYEMACIARQLNCPLLSYDSDFFIFDVNYIPFNTVILNSVKNSVKKNYKYLDCQIYKVDYFLRAYGGLKKDCIPLLGVLLGNDYVRISIFRNFYRQLKKSKAVSNEQQRRIKSLILWLQTETFESAYRKVLGRIKQIHRPSVAEQISSAANNYICSNSELLKYFDLDVDISNDLPPTVNVNLDDIVDIETDSSDLSDENENDDDGDDDDDESSHSDIDEVIESDDKKIDEVKSPQLPEYFEERYKKCLYPANFIDIILHHRHIFIPIIENYSEPPCHNISLNILSAICRILSSDKRKIRYILRNEKGRMQNFELSKSTKCLPVLVELQQLNYSESLMYFMDVLEIDNKFITTLNDFPTSWKLYILSIAYWIKNSNTSINECYIYALIMSAIALKKVDSKCCRNERKFLKKFHKDIEYIKSNPTVVKGTVDMTPKEVLDTITFNDGIMIMKEVVPNFEMNFKLQKNPKLFDRNIVHVFAQFQSCTFYIKYLNSLLNYPFQDYLISDFYNGTLIYNLCNNFLSRPQLDLYMQLIMKNSPNIYNSFIIIKTYLITNMSSSCVKNIVCKRRRKKKKKIQQTQSENEVVDESESDAVEDVYDTNNKFSILKIIDNS